MLITHDLTFCNAVKYSLLLKVTIFIIAILKLHHAIAA